MIAATTTDVLLSIDSAIIIAIIYIAISLAKLSERVARLEERSRKRRDEDD